QPFSQRGGRLDGGQLVAASDELEGEPPGSGGHLDDAGHVRREPFEDARVKVLGGNQPLVQVGLEAVEELPGQRGVALWVGDGALKETRRLCSGDLAPVGRGAAPPAWDG